MVTATGRELESETGNAVMVTADTDRTTGRPADDLFTVSAGQGTGSTRGIPSHAYGRLSVLEGRP